MKTSFTLLLFSLCLSTFGYNWTLYGPAGVHANNILFGAGNNGYSVICTNTGVCINNGPGWTWNAYSYGLPVYEAIAYGPDNFLLVMGDGTYSDGIYTFNLSSNTYNVVEWCYIPTFIRYCTTNSTYYAGTRFNGLLSSGDGITWATVPYFSTIGCEAMDYHGQHIVIAQETNIFGIYYSDDGGNSWNKSLANIPLNSLSFDNNGILYGVFTGASNSSGLYRSFDFGHTWKIKQYVLDMNTSGFDVMGNLFTGFHGAAPSCEGVAIFDTLTNNFTFLNNGLPNKNIHKFKTNPYMSSIAIFVCTDTGVYMCNNYITSSPDITDNNVKIYPNPAYESINIEALQNSGVSIISPDGRLIKNVLLTGNKAEMNISDIPKGIYFIKIKNRKGTTLKKQVIQ